MGSSRCRPVRLPTALVLAALLAPNLTSWAGGIPAAEYKARRDSLLARMEPHSVAVFRANEPDHRSNDVNYRYRQESNFLYLTGVDEPGPYLLLSKDGVTPPGRSLTNEVFFIEPSSRNAVTGETLGQEGAMRLGAFECVLERREFARIFESALAQAKALYVQSPNPDLILNPWTGQRTIQSRETKKALEEKYPGLAVKNPSSLVAELRALKSAAEIALLQQAIDATVGAHIEAMKSCEPAMAEYDLQAVVEYCFARGGAEYEGFPSIIGSGPNSCILHYDRNRRTMASGDVVVLDIGAEVQGYSADVTRTLPVSGKFTAEQKALYELVYNAQEAVFRTIRPGVRSSELTAAAHRVIGEGLVALGIIKDPSEAKTYTLHGVSHPIGLDVHDVGGYDATLHSGMVITVEPGVYVPAGSPCDQKFWNIGIRIEDDVLVTQDGGEVLSLGAPRSAGDVERAMKAKGMGNVPIGRL